MELTAIKENPDNPRFITDEKFKQLVDSIRDFPEMLELRPLVIDENNMTLGGNMRLKALKELGHKTIPAKWIKKASDLTAEQKNEFIIKDNVGFGEWDWVMFGQDYWKGTDVGEWGLDIPENVTIEEPIEDNFDPGPIDQIETDIRPGDIIQMGPHRLMCGDATNPEHWKKLMAGRRADLIVTDPPYNVDYQGGNGMKIMNDKQTSARFYRFLLDFHKALYNHTKPGGGWYEFHADSEGRNFRNAFEESGLMMKQCLVWVKNTLVMGRQDYHWKHEPILYGWKPGAAHYFIDDRTNNTVIEDPANFKAMKKDELLDYILTITQQPNTVIHADKPIKNDIHPTMKPILLLAELIKNSSKRGNLVADGFLGSGSTMVASHQLKRTCAGMELDPQYCQATVNRMKELDPKLG